jgi:CRP-like cAMP-binding protein
MAEFESSRPGRLLLTKLSLAGHLDVDAEAAIAALPFRVRHLYRDDAIAPAGTSSDLLMMLDGAAARYKTTRWGERLIVGFLLPGDVSDWRLFALRAKGGNPPPSLDHSIAAITRCSVIGFCSDALAEALQRHPSVGLALDASALVDTAITFEWLASLGSRPAAARVAHLLLEYYYRLQAVGLAQGGSCHLVLNQFHLSASQGLSLVHTNRVLQRLRAEGLVTLDRRTLTLLDQERLEAFADFSPEYLGYSR